MWRSGQFTSTGKARRAQRASDAKVTELRGSRVGQPDVLGLQISVDHASSVRDRERTTDVHRDAERSLQGQPASEGIELHPKFSPGDELGDDVRRTVLFAIVIYGHDVRVGAELGHRAGLALDASNDLLV